MIVLFSHKVFKKEWRANLSLLLKRILECKLYVVNCISSSWYYLLLMVNWRLSSFFQGSRTDIILECMFSLISILKLLLSICCKDTVIPIHSVNAEAGRTLMHCFVILQLTTSIAVLLTHCIRIIFPYTFVGIIGTYFKKIDFKQALAR